MLLIIMQSVLTFCNIVILSFICLFLVASDCNCSSLESLRNRCFLFDLVSCVLVALRLFLYGSIRLMLFNVLLALVVFIFVAQSLLLMIKWLSLQKFLWAFSSFLLLLVYFL